jgi:NAD+ dependent glucose-6-phosphate dehydrogenase
MTQPMKVLVTGAYGLVGHISYTRLAQQPDRYNVCALVRRRQPSSRLARSSSVPIAADKLAVADLTDLPAVQRAVQGIEVVVHMAADPSGEHGFETVLPSNIVGVYNILEASRLAGVKRVVVASTIQVVHGYKDTEPFKSMWAGDFSHLAPSDVRPITHADPVRSPNIYAASKVWSEQLAHVYSQAHGLSCICLRIGWVPPEDRPPRALARSMWCSHRDIAQIVELCVSAPASIRYDIFFGLSNNAYLWADIEHARQVLGYQPQDNAETYF